MKPIGIIQHLRIILVLIAYKINLGVIMNFKAKQFVDFESHKIFIDRAFQRKACWTDKTCREFIISANKGRAPYPIIVGDVSSGLTYSQSEDDAVSVEQYEKITVLRKDWVSLDGQNRVEAFRRLFNDELHLTGVFIDADGCNVGVKNQVFSALPLRLQDALKDCTISMIALKNCLYSQLHDIFVNINSGEPLNAQEKRNAINTPISSVIRDHTERVQISEMFKKFMVNNKKDEKSPFFSRSLDAEWVAMMYICTLQDYETSAGEKEIDNLYKIGKGKFAKDVPQYSRTVRTRFSKIINLLANVVNNYKSPKNPLAQKEFWGMLLVCEYIIDNNLEISDYQALSTLIVNINTKLSLDSSIQFSKDLTKAEESGSELPSKSSYYFFLQSNIKSIHHRNQRRKILIPAVVSSDKFKSLLENSEEEIA